MRKEFMTFRNEGLFTPPSRQGSVQMPGNAGGATWGSSAVDPNRGLMFVVSKERPAIIKLNLPGEKSRGQTLGLPPLPGPLVTEQGEFPRYDAPYDFMVMTNGLTTIGPPWSQITAYDLNTGTIKWQIPDGGVTALAEQGHPDTGAVSPRGGIVATAGGLLFVTTAFRPQIPSVRSGLRARVVGEGPARRSRRRTRGLRDRRTRIHRALRGRRPNQSADSNGWCETRGPGRRRISGLRLAAPVTAQEILVQTYAVKNALKTGIGTQAIQREVGSQVRGKTHELLRIRFFQELERFIVFVEAGIDGSHGVWRSSTLFCCVL